MKIEVVHFGSGILPIMATTALKMSCFGRLEQVLV